MVILNLTSANKFRGLWIVKILNVEREKFKVISLELFPQLEIFCFMAELHIFYQKRNVKNNKFKRDLKFCWIIDHYEVLLGWGEGEEKQCETLKNFNYNFWKFNLLTL